MKRKGENAARRGGLFISQGDGACRWQSLARKTKGYVAR